MSFGSNIFGQSTFAGIGTADAEGTTPPIGGPPEEELVIDPFTVEIDGESIKPLVNSLSIDNELGRQSAASFTLVNVSSVPIIGQTVRILWYNDLLFAGSIDRVRANTNNTESFKTYEVECVDYSYVFFRTKVKQRWANVQWVTLASKFLFAEGFTFGMLDPRGVYIVLPLVDADNSNVHDVLSEAAAAIGCLFYVDHNKTVNLVNSVLPAAPATIDENIAEHAEVNYDRETYRNKQTIIVTGTPASTSTQPVTITYTRQNTEQIAERAAIEGGTGIYNDIESITHPTSNSTADLQKLGVAYAKIRLGVQGSVRQWATVRTRQAGFKAGQLATVDIEKLGMSGTWIIQKVSIREEDGRTTISTLELSQSTLQRRAQELWLEVVKRSKIVALPPVTETLVTTQTFTTPGNTNFVVPGGVTQIQATCSGAGGGGGGSGRTTWGSAVSVADGGPGGAGGLAVSVLDVSPGETLVVTIGSGGVAGVSSGTGTPISPALGTAGGNGGFSRLKRGSTILVEATGGLGGNGGKGGYLTGALAFQPTPIAGYAGGSGAGIGQINTYGGGSAGGAKGRGSPFTQPTAGTNGKVLIEY